MTEQETCELTLLRHAIEALRQEVESLQRQVAARSTVYVYPTTVPSPNPWIPSSPYFGDQPYRWTYPTTYPLQPNTITYGATSTVGGGSGNVRVVNGHQLNQNG